MPVYTYENELTGEVKDIFQGMNDVHEYMGENGDELVWRRVFYVPNAAIDSVIDPFCPKSFADKTGTKKGTVGNLMDCSSEMSEKRAQLNGGVDPVKEKYFKEYSDKRRGAKHPKQTTKIETKHATIDFSAN